MNTMNRSAVVVTPAQPFLDWLHRVDASSADLTLEDLRVDPSIYLLPEWESDEDALDKLAKVSAEIFTEQLHSWHRVESVWPQDRDVDTFLRWFDCSFYSMVLDVCEERVRHTDM
jgi:hypothetical protein